MKNRVKAVTLNRANFNRECSRQKLYGLLASLVLQCVFSRHMAGNDFKPIDLGNTKQVRMNPFYQQLPQKERDHYENGLPVYNHDGVGGHDKNNNGVRDQGEAPFDRADIAAFCVRYRRGAAPLAATPGAPGNEKDFVAIMESLKTCVDDYLEPNKDPAPNRLRADDKILDLINQGLVGIGNPMTEDKFTKAGYGGRKGFVCIDHNLFFASLTRELGFPVRELNVPFSKMQDRARKYFYQEAATEVFFNDSWYYFDAYETKPPNKYKVERSPDGWVGGTARGSTISDRVVHFTSKGTEDYDWDTDTGDPGIDWQKEDTNSKFPYLKVASAAIFEQQVPGVRIFVTALTAQGIRLQSGWTPDLLGNPTVPDSIDDLLLDSSVTGARLDIPGSAYLPQGIEIPRTADPSYPVGTITNDTVTLDDPATNEYCVGVWNTTQSMSDFKVLVSTEGGVSLGLANEITGPPLQPGEARQLACGQIALLGEGTE